MKKSFLFAAAAALLLTSCTKDDVITSQNVSIDNTIKVQAIINGNPFTKVNAALTSTDSLKSFSMNIYNDGETVAENLTFSKPATAGDPWTHDGIYYWAAGKYSFYAVAQDNSASNAISKLNITSKGITIGTKTSPYVIATDGKTYEPKWNATAGAYVGGIYDDAVTPVNQPDPIVAADTLRRDSDNTGSKITTMNFHHALSRISAKLDSYDPKTANLKLVVLGYEFRQVGVAGYTTKAIVAEEDADTIAWTITTKGMVRENSVAVPDAWNASWTGSMKNLIPASDSSWCNVIPGDVATALVMKVALYDNTDNFVAVRYLTSSSDQAMKSEGLKVGTSKYAYLSGYQYTYHVEVTADGGSDTDKPTNPGLEDPNHDGPDPDMGDLKVKITSVTVEEWVAKDGGTAKFTGE